MYFNFRDIFRLLFTQACRPRGCRGVMAPPEHPQILADQLTLSQPGGADYAHQIMLAPPEFRPSYGPE